MFYVEFDFQLNIDFFCFLFFLKPIHHAHGASLYSNANLENILTLGSEKSDTAQLLMGAHKKRSPYSEIS